MQTEKKKKKQKTCFDASLSVGLVFGVIGSSVIVAIISFLVFGVIWAGYIKLTYDFSNILNGSILAIVAVLLLIMIAPLVTLIVTVKFLKGKYEQKNIVGILNLFFGGLISGILILIGSSKQNNIQDSMIQNEHS